MCTLYFQPFRFHDKCTILCDSCSQDQFVEWQNTIQFTENDPFNIIALPGVIKTVNIDTVLPLESNQVFFILIG